MWYLNYTFSTLKVDAVELLHTWNLKSVCVFSACLLLHLLLCLLYIHCFQSMLLLWSTYASNMQFTCRDVSSDFGERTPQRCRVWLRRTYPIALCNLDLLECETSKRQWNSANMITLFMKCPIRASKCLQLWFFSCVAERGYTTHLYAGFPPALFV